MKAEFFILEHRLNHAPPTNMIKTNQLLSLCVLLLLLFTRPINSRAQFIKDSSENISAETQVILLDTLIAFEPIDVVRFRSKEEEILYYKYRSRIRKVIPYVRIAKKLYTELQEIEEASKKRVYRKYRKSVEKEMREKFENELKDLTIGQGQMLVKLINRETGGNCYAIIKDIKGGFSAWGWQIVARRWGYNLKEPYDPRRERLIELAIRSLGQEYNTD